MMVLIKMCEYMNEIIICRHCGEKEYRGEFIWLNGLCMCRECYKQRFEQIHGYRYKWNDKDYSPKEIKELGR